MGDTEHERAPKGGSWKFFLFAMGSQLMFLALFAFAVDWKSPLKSHLPVDTHLEYPMWQDIHVMIYVGFGFLLVFPGKNMWNSVGFVFILGVYSFQWSVLTNGFFEWIHHEHMKGHLHLDFKTLINGDLCVAAILVSYSALVGKLSPFQLLVMAFIEVFLWALDVYICLFLLQVNDVGGALMTHAFGAYFGLALSFAYHFGVKKNAIGHRGWDSTYTSDTFAMLGSLFLFLYWPSYNAALASGGNNNRAVIVTVLALCSSSLVAVSFSYAIRGKFSMFDIQNACLAGGVASGGFADLAVQPWAGVLLGIASGFISILGYIYLSPFLERTIRLHDTAGIHNLHGIPGVIGGFSAVFASLAVQSDFWQGGHMGHIQAARSPSNSTLAELYDLVPGAGRSANQQAGYQAIAIFVCVFLALVGGLCTGLLLRLPFFDGIKYDNMYKDSVFWVLHDDDDPSEKELSQVQAGPVEPVSRV